MLPVVLVVLGGADVPEVLVQGRIASGRVLLCLEGSFVRRDGGQVALTRLRKAAHSAETLAACQSVSTGLLVGEHVLVLTSIKVRAAVGVSGRSGAVRSQEHGLVFGVSRLLVDLFQCTGYKLDTGHPFNKCHVAFGVLFPPAVRGG